MNNKINAYNELLDTLDENGYTISDIDWVAVDGLGVIPTDYFLNLAKATEYDPSYGHTEFFTDIVIMMKDECYYDRMEYDGSEWWHLEQKPRKPSRTIHPLALTSSDYYVAKKDEIEKHNIEVSTYFPDMNLWYRIFDEAGVSVEG